MDGWLAASESLAPASCRNIERNSFAFNPQASPAESDPQGRLSGARLTALGAVLLVGNQF